MHASHRSIARGLADGLITALWAPADFEGQSIRVGCFASIAYHSSKRNDLLDALVDADIALYKAKANGKSQADKPDAEQCRAVIERKSLADQVHLALEKGEFVPDLQPIVEAETEKIVSLEVLSFYRLIRRFGGTWRSEKRAAPFSLKQRTKESQLMAWIAPPNGIAMCHVGVGYEPNRKRSQPHGSFNAGGRPCQVRLSTAWR